MTSFPSQLRRMAQQYDTAVTFVLREWQQICNCHRDAHYYQAEPGNESFIPDPLSKTHTLTLHPSSFILNPLPKSLAPCPSCPHLADFEQRVARKIQELTPK